MKIHLTFKNLDIDFDIRDAVHQFQEKVLLETEGELDENLDPDVLYPEQAIKEDLRKWLEYGECLRVEYDTETKEMKIIPNQ